MRTTTRIVAVSLVAVLAACSSGDDDDTSASIDDPTGAGNGEALDDADIDPGTDPGTADGGVDTGGVVSGDGRAGVWLGDFGYGPGVYIVDGGNRLYGLALNEDGSARSTIGSIGDGDSFDGTLDDHDHPASSSPAGNAFAPQGDEVDPPVNYQLNIVEGQTIESLDGGSVSLGYAADGALADASPGAIDGTWVGIHTFGTGDALTAFDMTLSFSGNSVAGSTGLDNPDFPFEHTITGTLSDLGDVSTIAFDWTNDDEGTTRSYEGVVYFADDGSGDLIVNADYTDGPGDPNTLSSRLVRQ